MLLCLLRQRCWEFSGFSVDNSVYLSPGDTFGLQRLAQYFLRCPFSLARIIRLTEDGSVVYRAEKDNCHRFPGAASRDLKGGPSRNFQVLFSALDFLAELTQHIPEKNEHLIRYYGWYSHRRRGMRSKLERATPADHQIPIDRTALGVEKSVGVRPATGSPSTWAMLIKRIYEVDPLECGKCGSEMKIISFIERDQRPVIERILRGHWQCVLSLKAMVAPSDLAMVADRNLNPHKGIHPPHARYDFAPDPIHRVVGMQELSWISTELFGVLSGLSHSVQMCPVN